MTTWVGRVAASTDDADNRQNGQDNDLTGLQVDMRCDPTDGLRRVAGLRYVTTVPQGATINSAVISDFNIVTSNADPDLEIYMEDADAPATFSDGSRPSARVKTTATVSWVDAGAVTPPSPDFTAAMQEVVDRGSFGGTCAIITHANNNANTRRLLITSWDGNSSLAAELTVDYTVGGGGLSIPVAMHHYTKNIGANR